MRSLDEFDRKILALLQEDGRMPVVAIAEAVALSPTPCSRRIKRLEDEGYIERYAAVLSPKMTGFEIEAFVQVNLQAHSDANIERFNKAIAETDAVVACHAVTGDFDYLLRIVAHDMEHLSNVVLKRLVRIDGVRDVKSILVLDTVKASHGLPVGIGYSAG